MNYTYQSSTSYSSSLPFTVKKSDAPALFKRQRIMLSIVSFAMGVVLLFIHFLVSPKLSSLYSDLGATPSFITQNSKPIVIFLSLILFFFGYTVATSESITRNFEEKLRQYNDDSMIKTTDLIFTGHEAFLMILIGLAVGFLVSSIILPIYNLTSVV